MTEEEEIRNETIRIIAMKQAIKSKSPDSPKFDYILARAKMIENYIKTGN